MNVTEAPPASAIPAAAPARQDGSDFETFLKMLTAQMRNQDPLNPVENTDFAVQLATFSTVEQAVRTNDLLERLLGQGGGALGDPAGWLGLEAPVEGPAAFSGAPLALALPEGAEGLVVRDAAGQVAARSAVPPSGGTLEWASDLPPGEYTFWTEHAAEGAAPEERPVPVFRRVVEVVAGPDGAEIVTADGLRWPASRVEALRGG